MKPIKYLEMTIYESVCYYENQILYCGDNSHIFKIHVKHKFGMATLKDAIIELHIKNPSGELIVLPKMIESDIIPTEIALPENALLVDGSVDVEIVIRKDSAHITHPNRLNYGVRSRLSEDPNIQPPHHISIDELLLNIENKTNASIDRILDTEDVVASAAKDIVNKSELEMIKVSSREIKALDDKATSLKSSLNILGDNIISDLHDTRAEITTQLNTTGRDIKNEISEFIKTNDIVLRDDITRIVADVDYDGEYLIITRVNGEIERFKLDALTGQAIVDMFKVDTKKCSADTSIYTDDISFDDGYVKTEWIAKETVVSAKNMNKIELALEYAMNKIADLEYTPIVVQSYTSSKSIIEKGDVARGVVLSWVLNNNKIKSQTINNNILSAVDRNYVVGTVYSDATYRLVVEDMRNQIATASVNVKFVSGRYYGAALSNILDSVFLNGLNKELNESKSNTITVDATGNVYIYYAVPSRLGTLSFKVNGFEGGFNKIATINHSNVYGYTESYDIYRSSHINLGRTTITVS